MKVILLQDVAKIGRRSEVVEVPDGYALNQLIPKHMAQPATAGNMKRVERQQADTAKYELEAVARFEAAVNGLKAATLQISVEVNDQGNLFQAVHEADVARVAGENGVSIEDSMVKIATPIKEVGEHTLQLVQGEQAESFTIEVVKK